MTLHPGARLGPYEIDHLLGKGGMGVVYKARDTRLKREVAIKILAPEVAADPVRLRRFEQEAQAASALNHPNIATIYGLDAEDATAFIAMEHVPGRTLAEATPRAGLDVSRALHYAIQIADALAHAHGHGVIHRDLKPGNVMVTPDDRVKLLDFGLAKFVRPLDAAGTDVTRVTDDLTAEGLVLGTTRYMSPEQAQGQPLDARSDIFSCGSVLYEMITGYAAFQGTSAPLIATAIIREQPKPMSGTGRQVPRELERIVTRCLRKDRERRFQTAADLKIALEDLREESESASPSPPAATRRGRSRAALIAAVLAAVATVLAVGWSLSVARRTPANVRSEVVPLTSDPGNETTPSLSPDGTQVAYASYDFGSGDAILYVLAIETGARIRLTDTAGRHAFPRWSPDGKWVAYLTDGRGLFLVSPLGGASRRILDANQVRDYCWMPDGQRILYVSAEEPPMLRIVDIRSGEVRRVAQIPHYQRMPESSAVAVSTDGALIATGETDPVSRESRIVVRQFGGSLGEQTTVRFDRGGNFFGIQFLPERQGLLYGGASGPDSSRLYRSSIDGAHVERLPEMDYGAAFPTLSARADRLAFMRMTNDENMYRLSLAAAGEVEGAPVAFAVSTLREGSPNISRDGSRVTFASRRTGNPEIYVADPEGQHVQRLTSMQATIGGSPRFSPDGKWIAFDSRTSQAQADIFVISSDGGLPRNVSNHPATDTVPSWSRDGRFIYFHSDRNGSSQVWKMHADGSNPRPVTRQGGYTAHESLDGAAIFYAKNGGGDSLWTAGSDGGHERMLVPTLFRHNLAPGRTGIYLSTQRGLGGGPEILFYRFADQTTKTVLRLPRAAGLGLALAPDESWLLFAQLDGSGADLMLATGFSAGR